jgi:hypothetical protein
MTGLKRCGQPEANSHSKKKTQTTKDGKMHEGPSHCGIRLSQPIAETLQFFVSLRVFRGSHFPIQLDPIFTGKFLPCARA